MVGSVNWGDEGPGWEKVRPYFENNGAAQAEPPPKKKLAFQNTLSK
jgi:hypothetical protein